MVIHGADIDASVQLHRFLKPVVLQRVVFVLDIGAVIARMSDHMSGSAEYVDAVDVLVHVHDALAGGHDVLGQAVHIGTADFFFLIHGTHGRQNGKIAGRIKGQHTQGMGDGAVGVLNLQRQGFKLVAGQG